jgi:ferritin-like metal-binding protein YciE
MKLGSLNDLYITELKDIYSAEKQILKALPKMIKAANNEKLAAGFEEHLGETESQVERLEQIFKNLGASPTGHACAAMKGILEEGSEMIKADGDEDVIDAALIGAAQRVEHYEIAAYGCARTYARLLGREGDVELLQESLDEEGATDKKLTKLAETLINVKAAD